MDVTHKQTQSIRLHEEFDIKQCIHHVFNNKYNTLLQQGNINTNTIQLQLYNTTKHILQHVAELRTHPLTRCKDLKSQIKKLHEENNDLVKSNEAVVKENNNIVETIRKLVEEMKAAQEKQHTLFIEKEAFKKELIKTHNAFKIAKVYYKENLNIYYTIDEKQSNSETTIVHIEFFTSTKKKVSSNSVIISQDKTTRKCILLDMNPKLPIFDELAQRLHNTGDIPGFLSCVRTCFIKSKVNSKKI